MQKNKKRVSMVIADDIYDTLIDEANKTGVSVPIYCTFIVGQYLRSQKKAFDMMSEGFNNVMMTQAKEVDNVWLL